MRAGAGEVAAHDAPPGVLFGTPIVAQVHESAIANYGKTFLAGHTMTHKDSGQANQRRRQRQEQAMKQGDEDEERPWSMTFSREKPIEVKLRANRASVAILATHITGETNTGEEFEFNERVRISVEYELKPTASGIELVRVGEGKSGLKVELLDLPEGKTVPIRKIPWIAGIRTSLTSKIFRRKITHISFETKDKLREQLGENISVSRLHFGEGWAVAGLDFISDQQVPLPPKSEEEMNDNGAAAAANEIPVLPPQLFVVNYAPASAADWMILPEAP
jgi:hypothetical protein